MSKINQHKLISTLRFPEFLYDAEWKKTALENFCSSISSGKDKNTIEGEYNLYGSTGVIGKTKTGSYNGDFILVARVGANAGQLNKIKGKFGVTDNTLVIDLVKKDFIDFIFYSLTKIELNKLVFGSGQPLITGGQLKNLLLTTPPSEKEQQKIAACLSSLDDLITAENQKLETLKAHKNGLLQNLFPADGETVPKLRFKEFEGSEDWKETTFGAVAEFINGRAYKQEELLSNGKYRVLRVGNFFTNTQWHFSNLELDEDKYCKDGDLLYAWSASFGPRIWNGEEVIYHYHIWKVKNNNNANRKFLFYLLDYETEKMKSQSANGFALLHITKGTIENWKCRIPKSLKEQELISDTFSIIDSLIDIQIQKTDTLKMHKKGLMQGLFPDTTEITA